MRHFLLLAAAVLWPACRPGSAEKELAWVQTADPDQMFTADLRAGRVQFLEVCGISCYTPAVGPVTYIQCYNDAARVHTVDPTGDVIESEAHGRLKEQAALLARDYNVRMVRWLDSAGKRACGRGERWDDLWHAMAAVADSVPRHPFVTSILALGEPQSQGADFQLHVPDPVDLTVGLKARLCRLAPLFGIDRRIRFLVTTGDINDNPRKEPSFACERGAVAA